MASLNGPKAWGLLHEIRRRIALIINANSDEKGGREGRMRKDFFLCRRLGNAMRKNLCLDRLWVLVVGKSTKSFYHRATL